MRTETFSWLKVRDVVVISPNQRWMFITLQPMRPLFQDKFYGQDFPIPHIKIALHGYKTTGEVTRVKDSVSQNAEKGLPRPPYQRHQHQ